MADAAAPTSSSDNSGSGDVTVETILFNLDRAYTNKKKWLAEAAKDIDFSLGKHWEDAHRTELEGRAVVPLTINKIRPAVFLLAGIESQNRSDITCFPEGKEDSIKAEICTRLVKHAMKDSDGDFKVSEQFENGVEIGEAFLEPYLDYSDNILTAKLCLKPLDYDQVLWDDSSKEYDLSDAEFVIKITYDVTKSKLKQTFPAKAKAIEALQSDGKINLVGGPTQRNQEAIQHNEPTNYKAPGTAAALVPSPIFDLVVYYYKKYAPRYVIIDRKLSKIVQVNDKAEADAYLAQFGKDPDTQEEVAVVKTRYVAEIWKKSIIGGSSNLILEDAPAETFPNWKSYPLIPFFVYRKNQPMKRSPELKVQGIVRAMRDLNYDLDKRATQELNHLNATANSGWLSVKESFVEPELVKKYGSAPGINLEWDFEKAHGSAPQRINPSPLSQGHHELTAQRYQDMKEASGINTDLLAVQEGGQSSGRAISLRQKQGLVMVQKIFDNLSRTKKLLGKFIISQLAEIFDVETAMRVLGDAFIKDNFTVPVMAPMQDPMNPGQPMMDPANPGQPKMGPQPDPNKPGELLMKVDMELAQQTINDVLNEAELSRYDVTVAEGASTETTMLANYLQLMDMAKSGMPIPPEVLLEASSLPESIKQKIAAAIQAQQAALAQQPPAGGGGKPPVAPQRAA